MKAKAKRRKRRSTGKNLLEEAPVLTMKEIVKKTLRMLRNLGDQRFAVSPFNQYFDSWLRNLQEVLSEFESSPAVDLDEEFVKNRSQIFTDVERELAERRFKEASLEGSLKSLADTNHLLAQIDAEYAAKTREIGLKRNSAVEHLTRNIHDLEEELERISQMKTSIFGSFSKKIKTQKMAEVTQKLNSAKSELEVATQNFTVEQEKLHDEYATRKQAVIKKVQNLEKEVENSETDGSLEVRQAACEALANTINALLERKNLSLH